MIFNKFSQANWDKWKLWFYFVCFENIKYGKQMGKIMKLRDGWKVRFVALWVVRGRKV